MPTAGPYNLLRCIGRGGFGSVWQTLGPDGTELACKVSNLRRTDPNGFRFAREVRYQSQLLHAGIMPVLDFDLEAEYPWFTMPLAKDTLTNASARLTPEQVVQAVSRICEALSYAHKNGKIHRDLKPDNVLQLGNQENNWVIADFGLGRATDEDTSHRTATNVGGGSRGYAAPEQERNFKDADERADIFACGQILHYLLTGNTIPAGSPPAETTGIYSYLVKRSTAYSKHERYQQVDELYSDLQLLAYGGTDLRTPERQALSLLNQVARDGTSTTSVAELMRILDVNSLDQRLYLNVVPRIQQSLLNRMLDSHLAITSQILQRYMSYLNGSLPVDYIEMAGRFLEGIHQQIDSTQMRAQIAAKMVQLGTTADPFALRAQCARVLGSTSTPEDVAEFVRIYRSDDDSRRWVSEHQLANGLPMALARALVGGQ